MELATALVWTGLEAGEPELVGEGFGGKMVGMMFVRVYWID